MALPERSIPGHHRPAWAPGSDPIFLTLCGAQRGVNQFAREPQWTCLVKSAEHLRQLGLWQPHLLLAMPDHVHLIVIIPKSVGIGEAIRRFKRAASYGNQIRWQPAAFDHRIRSDDSYREKWQYVLANPKRAGLIKESAEWPYVRSWSMNAP
jgi:putative transposase